MHYTIAIVNVVFGQDFESRRCIKYVDVRIYANSYFGNCLAIDVSLWESTKMSNVILHLENVP